MDFEDDPSALAGKSDLKSKQRSKSLKGKMVEAMGSLVKGMSKNQKVSSSCIT